MHSSFHYLQAFGGAFYTSETGAGATPTEPNILKFGNLELDTKERVLRIYQVIKGVIKYDRHCANVNLTQMEFKILEYMFRKKDKATTRDELIINLDLDENINGSTINVHISKMRKKIRSAPYAFNIIETARLAGYYLLPEAITEEERQALLKLGDKAGDFVFIKSRSELYFGKDGKPYKLGTDSARYIERMIKRPGQIFLFSNKNCGVVFTEIKNLRKLLKKITGSDTLWIETIVGEGYCFRPDAKISRCQESRLNRDN